MKGRFNEGFQDREPISSFSRHDVQFHNRDCQTLEVQRDPALLKQVRFRLDTQGLSGQETGQMVYGIAGKAMDTLLLSRTKW